MKTSIVFVSFPILLIGFCCLSCDPFNKNRCKDAVGNTVLGYTFEIPYTITPAKDTIKVGDTIWLESSFSNQMYNAENGKTYTVNNFEFKIRGHLNDLATNPILSTTDYTLVNEFGQFYNTDRSSVFFKFDYKMEEATYKWKAGLIIKRPGCFALIPGSTLGLYSLDRESPPQTISNCSPENVLILMKRTNAPSNSYLLHDAADPYYREPSDFEQFESSFFAFYVKP